MAAPTRVSSAATAWNATTSPKTLDVAVQSGDWLVIVGITGDASTTLNTPTGGSLTYASQVTSTASSRCLTQQWTANATSSTTVTVSVTSGNTSNAWGFAAIVFRGSDGPGATATSTQSGAQSDAIVSITTTHANSAVVWADGDWAAVDGATRSYETGTASTATELVYFRDAAIYGVYIVTHADAGTAGAKSVGTTLPDGQDWSVSALEIKGSAASGSAGPVNHIINATGGAVTRAAVW